MTGSEIAFISAAVIAVIALTLYLTMTAGRLDRLHKRIDTAALTVDAHALRRSSVAQELAMSGLLDPASALLVAQAAHDARAGSEFAVTSSERAALETDLTRALDAALSDEDVREVRSDEVGAALLTELQGACLRLGLSRRFLNDAVRACRQVRRQRMSRWFHLSGHTGWPLTSDWDDSMPTGLSGSIGGSNELR
jgi:hypothetical protein